MGCIIPTPNSKGIISSNPENIKKRVIQPTNTDIRKNYEFISMLGHGSYGKVRLYRDRNYKDLLFAIKTLKKEGIPQAQFNLLKSEVSILSDLDHPNIVKYFGTFEDDFYIHILMEYLKGHDLNKIIALKQYKVFEEKDMANIIEQLLKALAFIHSKKIVHRDIKPENILFSNKRDYSTLKLIDFGLATTKRNKEEVGTPYFMSPETTKGNSCPKSDIWSVGIIVYLMITGKYAFTVDKDDDISELFEKIRNDDYDFGSLEISECSNEAKDFIKRCLAKNLNNRYNTQQCLDHPWIQKYSSKNDSNNLQVDVKNILLEFEKKTTLQKEIYYFIAKVSKESDLVELKKFFTQLDKKNNGTLSKEDIELGFNELGIPVTNKELNIIWDGLDFHKDGKINYSEFLGAMISSNHFENDEKLLSVFNLFKESKKNKNYITYESMCNAGKALNLNINEMELKKCFKKYDEELKFEDFKKIILGDEEKEEKFDKESTRVGRINSTTKKINGNNNNELFKTKTFKK